FFFSSRRRHTRWPRDWSSDVCSSDLPIKLSFARGDALQAFAAQHDLITGRIAIGSHPSQLFTHFVEFSHSASLFWKHFTGMHGDQYWRLPKNVGELRRTHVVTPNYFLVVLILNVLLLVGDAWCNQWKTGRRG